MTKPSREDVLRVAKECGFCGFVLTNEGASLERFAAAMYAAGAEAMRERAKEKFRALEKEPHGWNSFSYTEAVRDCEKAIDAITPTNTEGEQDGL